MKTSPLVALLLTVLVTEVTSHGSMKDLCATCPHLGQPDDNYLGLRGQCTNAEQNSDLTLRFSLIACQFLLRTCPSLQQKMCSQIQCVGLYGNRTLCQVGINFFDISNFKIAFFKPLVEYYIIFLSLIFF